MNKTRKTVLSIIGIFVILAAIFFGVSQCSRNNDPTQITQDKVNKITKSKPKSIDEAAKQVKDIAKVESKTKEGKQTKQMKINDITDDALDHYFNKNIDNSNAKNSNDINKRNRETNANINKFSKYAPSVTKTYKTRLNEWVKEQHVNRTNKNSNKHERYKKQDPKGKSFIKFKNHPTKAPNKTTKRPAGVPKQSGGVNHSGGQTVNGEHEGWVESVTYGNYLEDYKYYKKNPKVNKPFLEKVIKDLKKRGYKFNADLSVTGYEAYNKKLAERDEKLIAEGKLK